MALILRGKLYTRLLLIEASEFSSEAASVCKMVIVIEEFIDASQAMVVS